jgi:hypothetical protein
MVSYGKTLVHGRSPTVPPAFTTPYSIPVTTIPSCRELREFETFVLDWLIYNNVLHSHRGVSLQSWPLPTTLQIQLDDFINLEERPTARAHLRTKVLSGSTYRVAA